MGLFGRTKARGLAEIESAFQRAESAGRHVNLDGALRTGFAEAWLTDVEDDPYDMSWSNELPEGLMLAFGIEVTGSL